MNKNAIIKISQWILIIATVIVSAYKILIEEDFDKYLVFGFTWTTTILVAISMKLN